MLSCYEETTLRYDPDLCSGCETCVTVCPHGVFAFDGHRARLAKPKACMECGACQLNCPSEAITVEAGVGCAQAHINAILTGKKPTCGCDSGDCNC